MAIEIEGEDGSRIALQSDSDSKAVFGRGFGFRTDDKTVSRRHLLFHFVTQTGPRVSFEVLGKNPVWVLSRGNGDVRVFRKSDKGEMVGGDGFCVSGKRPVWFNLKKIGVSDVEEANLGSEGELELAESNQSGNDLESIDVSDIDPVKEFGFLVMGHEFDWYPNERIRDIKDWNWFLEEHKEGSDDDDDEDDVSDKKKRGLRRKRKKEDGENNDDDDWMGESEDDKELVKKSRKVDGPKYSTRSKDRTKDDKKSRQKKTSISLDEDDEETLGGFIVNDDNLDQEGEIDEDEEEEEFVEDDNDEEEDVDD